MNIDFEHIFNSIPGNYVILLPDSKFTIVAANNCFCEISGVKKENILNTGLFDAYPEDPNGKGSSNSQKVKHSILECIRTKKTHNTGIVRYDIPTNSGEYLIKYWSPTHTPILDEEKNVIYIIESALDITKVVKLGLEIPDSLIK